MSTVGLFGKIPAQGDFVRINNSDPAAQGFDPWCQEALAALTRSGGSLPADPVYFLYRTNSASNVLVGAMVPSEDKVGRRFPLSIFALVDAGSLGPRFSGMPVAYSAFLEATTMLLADASTLSLAELGTRLAALPLPGPVEHQQADDICRRTLEGTSGRELLERLFIDLERGQQYYAFSTMVSACMQFRGQEPPRASIVVDCPVAVDVDLFAWLELARRLLQWRTPPAFVWTESEIPRLLLSLGSPPPNVLSFLVNPNSESQRLWPLVTQRPEAIHAAMAGMPPHQRSILDDPGARLEALIAALST